MENEEILEQDLELEQEESEETITLTKKEFQTLKAQKEHWKQKATKVNEEPSKPEKVEIKSEANPDIEKRLEKIELTAKGYSDEEIKFIQSNGGKSSLENTFVKAAIEKIREQQKAEQASVETESSKSDIEKKYTTSQLKTMSAEELKKILPHADN